LACSEYTTLRIVPETQKQISDEVAFVAAPDYDAGMKSQTPAISISPELAAQYAEPGQFQRFDQLVRKVVSLKPERAAQVRRDADAIAPQRQGRPKKGQVSASRVPVSLPLS
jgi:hypothetical protein